MRESWKGRLGAVMVTTAAVAALMGACKGGGDGTEEPTFFANPDEVEGEPTEVDGVVTYTFTDTNQDSLIYVEVLAVEGSKGHDHVMRASNYTGTIVWDSANVADCQVDVSFKVNDIKVDENGMRELVGFDEEITDNQKDTVRDNMLAEDQLDADNYPNMSYSAKSCSESGGVVTMTGDLTIHGVTRSVSMDFTPSLTTEGLYASGTMSFTHRDFGIEPYKFTNLYENQNGIKMTLSVHGVPQE